MYKNKFCPSKDPKKGYQTGFRDWFAYAVDERSSGMEGAATIADDGAGVA